MYILAFLLSWTLTYYVGHRYIRIIPETYLQPHDLLLRTLVIIGPGPPAELPDLSLKLSHNTNQT